MAIGFAGMGGGSKVASAYLELGTQLQGFQKGIGSAKREMTSFGGFMKKHSTQFIKTGGLMVGAIGALGIATVKMAGDYDKAMRNVNTMTRLSEKQFSLMKDEIIDLTREVPYTATELAEAMYTVVSAGVPATEQMEFLATASRSASAGVAGVSETVYGLTGFIKGYGFAFNEAERISDLFFKTVELGQTTFEELAVSMGKVVPLASTLGVTEQELMGVMATLTGVTGNTAEVVTQFRGVLVALAKPNKEAIDLAKELGIKFDATAIQSMGLAGWLEHLHEKTGGNVETMSKLFGRVEALNGILALSGGQYDTFVEKTDKVTASAGAMSDAFDEQAKGVNFQLTIAKNNLQAVAISIGNELLPTVIDITESLNGLTEKEWENITAMAMFAGKSIAIVGSLLLVSGTVTKLIPLVKFLGTAIGTTGIMWGGLAGIAGGVVASLLQTGDSVQHTSDAMGRLDKNIFELSQSYHNWQGENDILRESILSHLYNLEDLGELYPKVAGEVNALIEQWREGEITGEQLNGKLYNMSVQGANAKDSIDDLTDAGEDANPVIEDLATQLENGEINLDEFAEGAIEATGEVEELEESVAELISRLHELYNTNQSVTEATWDYEDALQNLIDVQADEESTERDVQEAVFGVQDAREGLIDTIWREYETEGQSIERQKELQQEFVNVGKEAVANGEITEQAFLDMAKEFGLTGDSIVSVEATAFAPTYQSIYGQIINVNEKIDDTKDKLEDLDGTVSHVRVEYEIHEFKTYGGYKIANMPTRTGGWVNDAGKVMRYRGGGITPFVPETPAILHPRELVLNPSQQTNLAKMLFSVAQGNRQFNVSAPEDINSGGGGNTYNIVLNYSGDGSREDVEDMVDMLEDELDKREESRI